MQIPEAGWDGKVVEPSVEDLPQPFPGFLHTSMPSPAEFFLEPSQGTRYAFCDRLTPELETSSPVPRAIVREPEEIESLRSTLPPRSAVEVGDKSCGAQGIGRGRHFVTRGRSRPLIAHRYQRVAPMSVLVTRAAEMTSCGHILDGRRARCAPEPSARDRGSSPGSRLWPASAADSPPCSRDDTPSPSSSAGGAGCGGRAGIIARSADTYVVFGWSSVGSLRPPMMSRPRPISLPARARRGRRSRHEEDGFQ